MIVVCLEVEHGGGVATEIDFSFFVVCYFGPLLYDVFFGEYFIVECDLYGIDFVAKADGGKVAVGRMVDILQDACWVAVGMAYFEGRFVVVFRAHHWVNFEALDARTAQPGQWHVELPEVCLLGEAFAEIGLAEPLL